MTEVSTFHATLAEDGRFVIPAADRRRLGLKAGDNLIGENDGTSLRIRDQKTVIREAQAYFRQFVEPGVSVVDELIAERREEAAREEAETAEWLARTARD